MRKSPRKRSPRKSPRKQQNDLPLLTKPIFPEVIRKSFGGEEEEYEQFQSENAWQNASVVSDGINEYLEQQENKIQAENSNSKSKHIKIEIDEENGEDDYDENEIEHLYELEKNQIKHELIMQGRLDDTTSSNGSQFEFNYRESYNINSEDNRSVKRVQNHPNQQINFPLYPRLQSSTSTRANSNYRNRPRSSKNYVSTSDERSKTRSSIRQLIEKTDEPSSILNTLIHSSPKPNKSFTIGKKLPKPSRQPSPSKRFVDRSPRLNYWKPKSGSFPMPKRRFVYVKSKTPMIKTTPARSQSTTPNQYQYFGGSPKSARSTTSMSSFSRRKHIQISEPIDPKIEPFKNEDEFVPNHALDIDRDPNLDASFNTPNERSTLDQSNRSQSVTPRQLWTKGTLKKSSSVTKRKKRSPKKIDHLKKTNFVIHVSPSGEKFINRRLQPARSISPGPVYHTGGPIGQSKVHYSSPSNKSPQRSTHRINKNPGPGQYDNGKAKDYILSSPKASVSMRRKKSKSKKIQDPAAVLGYVGSSMNEKIYGNSPKSAWGYSKTKRGTYIARSITPGPGHYNVNDLGSSKVVHSPSARIQGS